MEISVNNICNNVNAYLGEEFVKNVVMNFIKMTINCEKYICQFPEKFKPYKVFYRYLKDDPNKGKSIYDDIIELNNTIQNGNFYSPITANQLGWYSYQSWHLSGDKKYHKGDISHRFYVSADSSVLKDFIILLKEKYEEKDVPYYFKVSNASVIGDTQKDGIVIYSSTDNLNITLSILQSI